MKNNISIITLGVRNFSKSFFDKGLNVGGVCGEPDSGHPHCAAFFEMENGLTLALYPLESLAEDATVPCEASSFSGITIAQNLPTNLEVDQAIEFACSIGAKLVKKPQNVFWGGYSGYISDPDGYLWEIASHENIEKKA